MIVTRTARGSRTVARTGERIDWRCLARRGMLHSECESIDHLRLAPGTEFALTGRSGLESVWLVVDGAGEFFDGGPRPRRIAAGDAVLTPEERRIRLRGGDDGLELLWIAVLPEPVSARLPGRKPRL
ncbi:mannose-6-phosphate isomerase-like protein (cupin superfamily) [Actinoplanes campanulatus]|uniref:Mannose-6-phosphate isomerase-like protein (Cupin superfamily) n=1 Tax=Actinoplanes campanulatus TaxID=113559 RepID=A0A7W5AIX8_9ACTN|nr:cupin domain-containing protein [Actinoplanes campanulatus]MBB3096921.1 mannose-6-phosphate isomerase-like protein (cupin superfamily) [Actinoplanes campanulatus]GGN44905.1 hypothetical protein GCM10010109_78530 [Actinoplanes campanulatus]GID37464.1 hypothetical protein Aca09nite_39700 [Actinoplanes campanulatus]